MARKPRIEFPGAFYHVMVRGNHKADIFRDDGDRERLLAKLLTYKTRYDFILYAYTLMPNHFHLLLETKEVALSKIMQGFLQSHTQWFNRKYKTVGHLFQGRYKAILCDKTSYLLVLVRYLHINCIRSRLAADPAKYKWSSHRIYLGIEASKLVDTELVLDQFSKKRSRAIHAYKSFVMESISRSGWIDGYQVTDQRFLGNENFVISSKKKIGEVFHQEDNILRNKTLDDVKNAVGKITHLHMDDIRGHKRTKELIEARNLFVRLAIKHTNSKRKEIAAYICRSPRMASHLESKLSNETLQRMEKKLQW
jgi:putative transposase